MQKLLSMLQGIYTYRCIWLASTFEGVTFQKYSQVLTTNSSFQGSKKAQSDCMNHPTPKILLNLLLLLVAFLLITSPNFVTCWTVSTGQVLLSERHFRSVPCFEKVGNHWINLNTVAYNWTLPLTWCRHNDK